MRNIIKTMYKLLMPSDKYEMYCYSNRMYMSKFSISNSLNYEQSRELW